MSQRILVTGGDGYLGTHLTSYFQATSASRRSGWDLLDPSRLEEVGHYDVILHLAAVVNKSPEQGRVCLEANLGMARVLAAALRPNQTLIFASTKDVYGLHSEAFPTVPETCPSSHLGQNAYAWSKLLSEEVFLAAAARTGFRLGIFRLSTIFAPPTPGNGGGWVSKFSALLREGGTLKLRAGGKQVRDILPASELARALAAFLESERNFGLYNIGGGIEYSGTLGAIGQRLADLHGRSAAIRCSDEPVPGDQFRYVSNLGRLATQLGWQPAFDLTAALATA